MDNVEYIISFLNGKVSGDLFFERLESDDSLKETLNALLPKTRDITDAAWKGIDYKMSLEKQGFDVFKVIQYYGGTHSIEGKFGAYALISQIAQSAGFDVPSENPYDAMFDFVLAAVPSYVGGKEASIFIENLFRQLPEDLSDAKRKSLFKKMIKDSFPFEGKKPSWAQEPEWPVNQNGPLTFVSQRDDGDETTYIFKDSKTGQEVEVKQLW